MTFIGSLMGPIITIVFVGLDNRESRNFAIQVRKEGERSEKPRHSHLLKFVILLPTSTKFAMFMLNASC